ncbi:MAG: pyrroline-5-carboxylate reductase, partial [Candidatus Margulisiibacteriota bacterium]
QELSRCDICVLAIKPQDVSSVVEELSKALSPSVLIVSIVAGIGLGYFTQRFPLHRSARVMPNTPALIKEGISGVSFSPQCTKADQAIVLEVFRSVGGVQAIPDSLMNAVTALSGSGPAYYYLLTHYYAKIAEGYGMDYALALTMMTQTMLGAAKMIQTTQLSPEELIRMVASPGGTTEAALKVLREPALFEILTMSYSRAHGRAKELDPSS